MECHANVENCYLNFLLAGTKTIEGRINRGKWKSLKINDTIIFNDQYRFIIKRIRYYSSFREMLEIEGVNCIIPNAASLMEAINIYEYLYASNNDLHDIIMHGVVALEVEAIV